MTVDAADDWLSGAVNNSLYGNVLSNDSESGSNALTASLLSGPSSGYVSLNADGSFSYSPNYGFYGTDSFTYQAEFETESDSATVSLVINGAPTANNDSLYLYEDDTLALAGGGGITGNDYDPEGDPLTIQITSWPYHGTLTWNPDGSPSYTPNANFNGYDSFSYTLSDGWSTSSSANVYLTIYSVNDPPVAVDDYYTLDEDSSFSTDWWSRTLSNDSDPDGPYSYLWAYASSWPSHGSLWLNSDGSFNYTPNANFNGSDSFTYYLYDGSAYSNTATVWLTVNSVNDPPIAADDYFTLDEDTPLHAPSGSLLANDSDLDSTWLSTYLVSAPSLGAVSVGLDGSFVYTPNENSHGWDSFSYYTSDGSSSSGLATVYLTINASNDPPAVVGDSYVVAQNSLLSVVAPGVLGNDSDVEGNGFTAHLADGPAHGQLTLQTDGSFVYQPNPGYFGTDSFAYYAHDGWSSSATATVSIVVAQPLVALGDVYRAAAGKSLTVAAPGVLGNDHSPSGGLYFLDVTEGPAHGWLSWDSGGDFVYTPHAGFTGTDHFRYRASDGYTLSHPVTVAIQVRENQAAALTADSFTILEDQALVVAAAQGVLANDVDADGDPLVVEHVGGPASGALTLLGDGSLRYTPAANFHGAATFTYRVHDGLEWSEPAQATIQVVPVNDAPVAVAESFDVLSGQTLVIASGGLLANDTDADGDPLTARLITGPKHGALALESDGGFTYIPGLAFVGIDEFSYVASDGGLDSAPVLVRIRVHGQSTVRVASDDFYLAEAGQSLSVSAQLGLLANDFTGGNVSLQLMSEPAHGALTLAPSGGFVYTPAASFSGTETFRYRLSAGFDTSNTAEVTILLQAVAPALQALDDAYPLTEDLPHLASAAEGVLANDAAPAGTTLSALLHTAPRHGFLTLEADGSWSYTPVPDFSGQDQFQYVISDGVRRSEPATVVLTIAALPDEPQPAEDAYPLNRGEVLTVASAQGVLANDLDPDGDALVAQVALEPAAGTLVLEANGGFTYTPNPGFWGVDQFTYTVTDGVFTSLPIIVRLAVDANDDTLATARVLAPAVNEPTLFEGAIGDEPPGRRDVDLFRVEWSAGEQWIIDLDAAVAPGAAWDSRLDARLRIFSSTGEELAHSDDAVDPLHQTRGIDPAVKFTVLASGVYFLGISAAENFAYDPAARGSGEDGKSEGNYQLRIWRNMAPIAAGDAYQVEQDGLLAVSAAEGVLANDSDLDGPLLQAQLVSAPAHGLLLLGSGGEFTYVPAAGFSGTDSFSYRATDGLAESALGQVTITVQAVNRPPVSRADSYVGGVGGWQIAAPGVLANDSDEEDSPLTAELVTGPLHGVLELLPDGSFSYVPEAGFVGSDRFQYRAFDGEAFGAIREVSLLVRNRTPWSLPEIYTVAAGQMLAVPAQTGVLANDGDPDGGALRARLYSPPASGQLQLRADGSFDYIPAPAFTGVVTFEYDLSDAYGATVRQTSSLEVTAEEFVAQNDAYYTRPGQTLEVSASAGPLANDWRLTPAPLTAELLTPPAAGTLTLNTDGSFSYTAASGFSGEVSFDYRVSDGTTELDATVSIQIANVAPTGEGERNFTLRHGRPLEVAAAQGLLLGADDADGDSLSVQVETQPTHGTLTLLADGAFQYAPQAGYVGQDEFTYRVFDGADVGPLRTVRLEITNEVPVPFEDSYRTGHGVPLIVSAARGVLALDFDPDGDALIAELVDAPQQGTLDLLADGSFSYLAPSGFAGEVTFSYRASDGLAWSNVVNVRIAVTNRTPRAIADRYVLAHSRPLEVSAAAGLLANDSDGDLDALTIESFGLPYHGGTFTVLPNGSFTYTPAPGFTGVEEIGYTISDGVATAYSSVTFQVGNRPPLGREDEYVVPRSGPLAVSSAGGVLGNDADGDGDPLVAQLWSSPRFGSVGLNHDGSFQYTPNSDFVGVDRFEYIVSDGTYSPGVSPTPRPITVWLVRNNRAPLAGADRYVVVHDQWLEVSASAGLFANDFDLDQDALSLYVAPGDMPQHGSLTLQADGSFTYQPNPGYVGRDGFTYVLSDGIARTAPVRVDFDVVNQAPVAVSDVLTVHQGRAGDWLWSDLLGNDLDSNPGETLSVTQFTAPRFGAFFQSLTGISYSPKPGFTGRDTLYYRISDGLATSALAAIHFDVVNTAPLAVDDAYSTDEDTPLFVSAAPQSAGAPGGVAFNDQDADEDALVVTLIEAPLNGQVALQADGSFNYTPRAGFHGEDRFIYSLSDGAESRQAVARIVVRAVADLPIFSGELAAHPGKAVEHDLLDGLANPDELALRIVVVDLPEHGELTWQADGRISYTADEEFLGYDSFSFRILADGVPGELQSAVLHVTNAAPVSPDRAFTTYLNHVLVIPASDGLTAWASDADSDPLTVSVTVSPQHGVLAVEPDGSFVYTPVLGYVGLDAFEYSVSDGIVSVTSSAVIDVSEIPIITRGNHYSVLHDRTLTVTTTNGLLRDDWHLLGYAIQAVLDDLPLNGVAGVQADGSFTYTPAAGYVGPDAFSYVVTDGVAITNSVVVLLDVRNAVPITAADAFRVHRGQTLTVVKAKGVLINDYDDNRDPLTVAVVAAPLHGQLTLEADGAFTYEPAEVEGKPYVGADSFTYRVFDGAQWSLPAVVSIAVENQKPKGQADSQRLHHTELLDLDAASGLLRNDVDADGDPITAELVDGPANGVLNLEEDGSFIYAPLATAGATYVGGDSFIYRLFDGAEYSDPITVSIDVWNNLPKGVSDLARTKHGVSTSGNVLTNDVDWDEDDLTVALVEEPSPPSWKGTLSLQPDGNFTYEPGTDDYGKDFSGKVTFSYTIFDGAETSSPVDLVILVENQLPVGVNDYFVGPARQPINENVITKTNGGENVRDFDPDGDELTVELIGEPAHAESFQLSSSGEFSYVPTPGFVGTDSFTYRLFDPVGAAPEEITVTLEVRGKFLHAVNDQFFKKWGEAIELTVLANDLKEGEVFVGLVSSQPGWSVNGQKQVVYTRPDSVPNQAPEEGLSVEYFISEFPLDVEGAPRSIGTASVSFVQDAVTAIDDTFTVSWSGTLSKNVRQNDKFFDIRDDGTFTVGQVPETGWNVKLVGPAPSGLIFNPNGSFTYTPSYSTQSVVRFSYEYETAAKGLRKTAKVAIRISDDTWTPADRNFSLEEDSPLAINPADLGQTELISYELMRQPRQGTLSTHPLTGRLIYSPRQDFFGADSFTYRLHDGNRKSQEVLVKLTVGAKNDAPIAKNDFVAAIEDEPITFDVLLNDWDIDSQPTLLEAGSWIEITQHPEVGTAQVVGGKIRYTPADNFYGQATLRYRLHDRAAGESDDLTAEATVTVNVAARPDDPIARQVTWTIPEDSSGWFNLAEAILDYDHFTVEGGQLSYAELPWGNLVEIVSPPGSGDSSAPVLSGLSSSFVLNYTPQRNWSGSTSVTFKWYDTDWNEVTSTATIVVTPDEEPEGGGGGDPPPNPPPPGQVTPFTAPEGLQTGQFEIEGSGGGLGWHVSGGDFIVDVTGGGITVSGGGGNVSVSSFGHVQWNGEAGESLSINAGGSVNPVTIAGDLTIHAGYQLQGLFKGRDVWIYAGGGIAEVEATRDIQNVSSDFGNVGKVSAGSNVYGVYSGLDVGEVSAGERIFSVYAGNSITGDITAEDDIWNIYARNHIEGQIKSAGADIGIISEDDPHYNWGYGWHWGVYAEGIISGDVRAPAGAIGHIYGRSLQGATIDAAEEIIEVRAGDGPYGNITEMTITAGTFISSVSGGGDFSGTLSAGSHISHVWMGDKISGTITAGTFIGSVAGNQGIDATIHAGGDIGQVNATKGNIAGSISASQDISWVNAGGGISASVSAGRDLPQINADKGNISGALSAGRDIGQVLVIRAGISSTITAQRDINNLQANTDIGGEITARRNLSAVRAERDVSATVTGVKRIDSVHAGRDVKGEFVKSSDGSIGTIWAGRDLTAKVSSQADLNWIRVGRDATKDLEVGGDLNYFGIGRELSGDVRVDGKLGGIAAGVVIDDNFPWGNMHYTDGPNAIAATRDGKISSKLIRAGGDIDSVSAHAVVGNSGRIGGEEAVEIFSQTGSIHSVSAAGPIHASVRAQRDLQHVSAAYYNPGDLTGKLSTYLGDIVNVSVRAGSMIAELKSGQSIGAVHAGKDVTGSLTAAKHIGHVQAGRDVTSTIKAKQGDLGRNGLGDGSWYGNWYGFNYWWGWGFAWELPTALVEPTAWLFEFQRNDWEQQLSSIAERGVRAGRDILSQIDVWGNVGVLAAGNNVGSGDTIVTVGIDAGGAASASASQSSSTTTERGQVAGVIAGLRRGGNIELNLKASGAVSRVVAYGETSPLLSDTSDKPSAGPEFNVDPASGIIPFVRMLTPLLEERELGEKGNIKGEWTALSLDSVAAYRNLEAKLSAVIVTHVWALGDVVSDEIVGAQGVTLDVWGTLNVALHAVSGDITAQAYGDITQLKLHTNNNSLVAGWSKVKSENQTGESARSWSRGDAELSVLGVAKRMVVDSFQTLSVAGTSLADLMIRANSFSHMEVSSFLPAVLFSAGDSTNLKVNSIYALVAAGKNISDLNLKAISTDVMSGGDLDNSIITTIGRHSGKKEALAFAIDLMRGLLFQSLGFGNSATSNLQISIANLALYTGRQAAEALADVPQLGERFLKDTYNFVKEIPDNLTKIFDELKAALDSAKTYLTQEEGEGEASKAALQEARDKSKKAGESLEKLEKESASWTEDAKKAAQPYLDAAKTAVNNVDKVVASVGEAAGNAVDSAVGFATVTVLGNVSNLTATVGSQLMIAAGGVTGGKLTARDIEIAAQNNVSAKINASRNVTINAFGAIAGDEITAGDTIEIHATKNISTTAIKADNAIGIETWGAVSSKSLTTNGILRIEAYQGVSSTISARLAASVVSWADVTSPITSKYGAIDVFSAKNVTGKLSAYSDVSIDAWGDVTSPSIEAGQSKEPLPPDQAEKLAGSEFGIGITAQGRVTSTTIKARDGVEIVAQQGVMDSKITAKSVSVSSLAEVYGITVDAKQFVSVVAQGDVNTNKLTADGNDGAVSIVSAGRIHSSALAHRSVSATAQKTLNLDLEVTGIDGEVNLTALGKESSGTVLRAKVKAPLSKVEFFANGAAHITGKTEGVASALTEEVASALSYSGVAMGDLSGTYLADDSIDLSSWSNITALKAEAKANSQSKVVLFAGGDLFAIASSGGDLLANSLGSVRGVYDSGLKAAPSEGHLTLGAVVDLQHVVATAKGNLSAHAGRGATGFYNAGVDVEVVARNHFDGSLNAQGNATLEVVQGQAKGSVFAKKDATVAASDRIIAQIYAGGPNQPGSAVVSTLTEFSGTVSATKDANISAHYRASGQFYAGRDLLVVSADLSGKLTAGRDLTGTAAGGAGTLLVLATAGQDASLSSTGPLAAAVEASRNANLSTSEQLLAVATTLTGDVDLAAGQSALVAISSAGAAKLFTVGPLGGVVTAAGNITAAVWSDLQAQLSAGANLEASVQGSLQSNLSAAHNLSAVVVGDVTGNLQAGKNITLLAGGHFISAVDAGEDAQVNIRGELFGIVEAGHDAHVSALGKITGPVFADRDLFLTGWDEVRNVVFAGRHATVVATGELKSNLLALGDLTLVGYDEVDVIASAGENLDLTAYASAQAQLTAGDNLTALLLADAQLEASAGENITLTVLDLLEADLQAGGNVSVTGYSSVSGQYAAAGDLSVSAVGGLTGQITAGAHASATVIGTASQLQVSGAQSATAFATGTLRATVQSSGGEVNVSGGTLHPIVNAATDASVFGLDFVDAQVTAGDSVWVFSGGILTGQITAAVDAWASSLQHAVVTLTAGRDAGAVGIGDSTVIIHAGRNASAASYGNLHVDLFAAGNVSLVWSRGALTGAIHAGQTIEQLTSYASIAVGATARQIHRVEAWGAIGGALLALEQIGLIRSGDVISAQFDAPVVGAVHANDPTVFEDYPETPDISLESFRAWVRGLIRDLEDAKLVLTELRDSQLREITVDAATAGDDYQPSLGDPRSAPGDIRLARNQILQVLAQAKAEDDIALKTAARGLEQALLQLRADAYAAREKALYGLSQDQFEARAAAAELQASVLYRTAELQRTGQLKSAEYKANLASAQYAAATWPADFQEKVMGILWQRMNFALDLFQLTLDLIGFLDIPIAPGVTLGMVADLLNSGVSLLRGNFVDAGINFAAAAPLLGNAAAIGKLSAKFGKGVGAALSFSDEALDLANAAKKGLSYLATKALPFLRAPGNLLSSQVRGFCDFARSIGKKLGATDEIYDLLGIGCFGEGESCVIDVIGILPTEPGAEDDARAALFFVMAAVSIPGVCLVGYRVLNRDRRSARDALFAEWEDLLPHLGGLPPLDGEESLNELDSLFADPEELLFGI